MAEVITRVLAASTELGDGSSLADHLDVRSAGTGPWHEGEPMHDAGRGGARPGRLSPTTRTWPTSSRRRSSRRSTSWSPSTAATNRRCGAWGPTRGRLALLRAFDPAAGAAADVPDPYYGDDGVFDECRDMIAAGMRGPRGLPGRPLGLPLGGIARRPRASGAKRLVSDAPARGRRRNV